MKLRWWILALGLLAFSIPEVWPWAEQPPAPSGTVEQGWPAARRPPPLARPPPPEPVARQPGPPQRPPAAGADRAGEPSADPAERHRLHAEHPESRLFSVSEAGVQAAVSVNRPQVQYCYEAWRRFDPTLPEVMSVSVEISPDDEGADEGRLTQVEVPTRGAGSGLLAGCVANVLSTVRFASPSHPTRVTLPVKFGPVP